MKTKHSPSKRLHIHLNITYSHELYKNQRTYR